MCQPVEPWSWSTTTCAGDRDPPLRGLLARSRRRRRGRPQARTDRLGQSRRSGGARHPVDPAVGRSMAHGDRPDPSPRGLQRALRLPPAGRGRIRRARVRDPLREQRHGLPPRQVRDRRADGGERAAPARGRAGRAARQQRGRLAHGAEPRDVGNPGRRPRRRLRGPGRPPRRRRVHVAGHRSLGHRRSRPVLGRPRPRHVQPRQRLASLARAGPLRPVLAGALPRRPEPPSGADRRDGPADPTSSAPPHAVASTASIAGRPSGTSSAAGPCTPGT